MCAQGVASIPKRTPKWWRTWSILHYARDCAGDLMAAVRQTLAELEGSYALGVLCADDPDRFIAARKDSPLVIGLGEDGHFIASDIPALLARRGAS